MTLAPLSLDTLAWEDLRQLGQQQAPLASAGHWTHHAASDPGITLLELFAFLLDQQLFVMDQLSPEMQLAIMALLGDAPKPAGVAQTIVAAPLGSIDSHRRVRRGEPLVPALGGGGDMQFSFAEDALLLPVAALNIHVDGSDLTGDLAQGRTTKLFGASPVQGVPALEVEITLNEPLDAALVGEEIALAMLLEDDAGMEPEWSPRAEGAPPAFDLSLGLEGGVGSFTPAAQGWQDGTGGLRRSGLIRFALPDQWQGRTILRLTLDGERQRHAEPPVLRQVWVGGAVIRHARTVHIERADNGEDSHDALRAALEGDVADWLPLSGNELELPGELYPVIETSLELSLPDRNGEWHEWHRADSLFAADGGSRFFTFERARSVLSFGDGYNGRVPAPADNLELSLEIGGGAEGNHPAGVTWQVPGTPLSLTSLVEATGGSDPETLVAAQTRISRALTEVTRAVTSADHAELVETAPGVGRHRASVALGMDPAFPCVNSPDSITVFVVPITGEDTPAPTADDGALAHFRSILDEARLLTTRVFVEPVTLRPVEISVELAGLTHVSDQLAELIRRTVSRYLHPALGGSEGDGWPFGHPLRPSELMRAVSAVLPDSARVAEVAVGLLDEVDRPLEACTDTPIGPHELPWLTSFRLTTGSDAVTGAVL